ncbi:MAG: SprT family zinc-dependent metalloprotease [Syntrophobacteraceae bacterium]
MFDFEYSVVRSARRKTVGLAVFPDGRVTVTAPHYATDEQIGKIVEKKSAWIRDRLDFFRSSAAPSAPVEYKDGTELLLLGRRYRLKISEGLARSVKIDGDSIHLSLPLHLEGSDRAARIAAQLRQWYGSRALEVIHGRVRIYRERLGVRIGAVKVKALRSRWGSCSSRGNLSFGWQLVMAPMKIVDYVVVHELCHILCMDHSPRFWAHVESILPDCRRRRDWLRDNGSTLVL